MRSVLYASTMGPLNEHEIVVPQYRSQRDRLLKRIWTCVFGIAPTLADYENARVCAQDKDVLAFVQDTSYLKFVNAPSELQYVSMESGDLVETQEDAHNAHNAPGAQGAKEARNPLTCVTFSLPSDVHMSVTDCMQFAMTRDIAFQMGLIRGSLVVIFDSPSISVVFCESLLNAAMISTGARPYVLWIGEKAPPRTLVDVWVARHVNADILHSIPRLARLALIVNDIDFKPTAQLTRDGRSTFVIQCSNHCPKQSNPETGLNGLSLLSMRAAGIDIPNAWITGHLSLGDGGDDLAGKIRERALELHFGGAGPFAEFVMRRRCISIKTRETRETPRSMGCVKVEVELDLDYSRVAVVAVETRPNALTVFAILQTLSCLRDIDASVVIFVSTPDIGRFFSSSLAARGVSASRCIVESQCPCLSRKGFSLGDYNELLKNTHIWSRLTILGFDHALIVQDDGMLIRYMPADAFKIFSRHEYVGAPWAEEQGMQRGGGGARVGNGGLSLRNVAAMTRICNERHEEPFLGGIVCEPEDVFFSLGVRESCPVAVAGAFASEQILTPMSFGMHKIWRYHTLDACAQFFAHIQ